MTKIITYKVEEISKAESAKDIPIIKEETETEPTTQSLYKETIKGLEQRIAELTYERDAHQKEVIRLQSEIDGCQTRILEIQPKAEEAFMQLKNQPIGDSPIAIKI